MNDVATTLLALSVAAVLGLALGRIRIRSIGLGIGGVLFAGLAVGHVLGDTDIVLDRSMLIFAQEFGLILFVYAIGIQVGPGFFNALKRRGLLLNAMAVAVVVLGAGVAALIYLIADLPLPVVLGLLSGAVTNTPSLGAAQDVLMTLTGDAETAATPGLGYAVAYPFGIAGILIAMIAIRAVFRVDVAEAARRFEDERRAEVTSLEAMDVVVRNANLDGLAISQIPGLRQAGVVVSRLLHNDVLTVPREETAVAVGDVLHLVGRRARLREMQLILGEESEQDLTAASDTDIRWERLVVTSGHALGRSIAQLDIHRSYGVVISRITRAGIELSPTPALHLQFGDILTTIGRPDDIAAVANVVGNAKRRLDQVQMLPIFLGIGLGLLLGSLPLQFPGMPAALKLGLAGGPLVVAILLSRIGNIGPIYWFMPPSANNALREIGIVLFLAVVGIKSGDRFIAVLVEGDGLLWIGYGAVITLIPLLVVGVVAQHVMRLNYLTTCGLLAGSMTDPPALAFANQISPSEAPSLAYATVYPLVMCLRIVSPQILALALFSG